MIFFQTLINVFIALSQIAVIVLCGFFFFRRKLISEEVVGGLNSLTVYLFLPCLMFNHLVKNFNFHSPSGWWVYFLTGIIVSGIGFILAKIFLRFDPSIKERDEFVCLLSFQNCGYLPLILVAALFSGTVREELITAILLFMQGFNIIFWTMGIQLLSPKAEGEPRRYELRKIWNPPFVSLLLSMGIVAVNAQDKIPVSVLRSIALVGDCTLPVALITLGAVLAECWGPMSRATRRFLEMVVLGKLVVMPALILIFIFTARPPAILALLLVIEASMPAAINLSVVALHQNSRCSIVSQAVLWTHVLGMVTIPFYWALMNIAIPY